MEEEFRKEDFGIMVNLVEYERFKELEEENRKLKGKIGFLEQCLDNKEKVNKSLREENKRLEKEIAEYLDAIRNINH